MANERVSRGSWASGWGFVLAAAGSAVGLGNVWRFPYITGDNGGGLFVLIYLLSIALVGLPIMIGEVMIGRSSQRSTVSAYKALAGPKSGWVGLGWLGVSAAFLILSFYAVVAGWAVHYTLLSLRGAFVGKSPEAIQQIFANLNADAGLSLVWLVVFLALTVGVVLGGVRGGLERWSRVLMPALFLMFIGLAAYATTLDGFGEAFGFVFGLHADKLHPGGVVEALGHSFFTLSVGLGGMLTYGSYLDRDADIVGHSVAIAILDTVIALLACLVVFPIIFSQGLEPSQGPGLIFVNLPIAFSTMPGGAVLAPVFFSLLVFAALTSAISLLEVVTAYFIDERGWSRRKATLVSGLAIGIFAVPSALTGSSELFGSPIAFGRDWFSLVADLSSNFMLPLGGLGMAVFIAWRVGDPVRRREFTTGGGRFVRFYGAWLGVLRFFVPFAVLFVFLHAVGVI